MSGAGDAAPVVTRAGLARPGLALAAAAVVLGGLLAFALYWHVVAADRIDDSDPMIALGFLVVVACVPGLLVLAGATLAVARGWGAPRLWEATGWLLVVLHLALAGLVACTVVAFPPTWVDDPSSYLGD